MQLGNFPSCICSTMENAFPQKLTKTILVAVGFPYGPGFPRAALRSGSRALARVALASLALAKLTMCA
jgi:hypothetical protein